MSEPVVAGTSPIEYEVKEGRSYWWCACGKSANQPFCDGSHKDTEFTPVQYEAKRSRTVYFCACKKSSNSPLCDGTHNDL